MIDWDALVLAPVMGVFGDAVLYRPRDGQPFTVADAVYTEAYTYILRDSTGGEITTTSPALSVRQAACPVKPKQDDGVDISTIDGRAVNTRFVVKDVRDDGHGHLVLLLNIQAPL